jgi:hypothetical protein
MKYSDPIVEEIHRIWQRIGQRYGFDIRRIARALREKEGARAEKLTSRPAPA